MFSRTLAFACLLACSTVAQAAVLFSDNFNADAHGLNATAFSGGWTVTNGTVDTIGTGYFDLFPGHGNYIDLDGSSNRAGVLSKSLTLSAGVSYTASFDLGGNQRNAGADTVDVSFGGNDATFLLNATDPFGKHSLSFIPAASGSYLLSFHNRGGDNMGAVLDNVSVNAGAVPEPSAMALLFAGLAGLGFTRRRRASNSVAAA